MHLFLRDRRPRWLSALLIAAAVFVVLAVALAWLRVDLYELRAFLSSPWSGPEGERTAESPEIAPSAASSADVRAQIALAKSYADLGRRAEGLDLLARLADAHPEDGEIAYARASLLAQGTDRGELETAFALYEAAAARAPRLGALARLYQGMTRARLGDAPGALAIWRDQLALQPEAPYRSLFEDAIARAGG